MKLFLLQMQCSDYYCGCGGGHPVGIYTSEELAKETSIKAEVLGKQIGKYTYYNGLLAITPLEVDGPPLSHDGERTLQEVINYRKTIDGLH
jgi:hypothetical protein